MSNLSEDKIFRYVIVDDDDIDRLTLGHFLKDYYNLEHLASFSAPTSCLNFLEHNKVDVLFLDVEMPGMNGLQLLHKVKDKVKCAIFITSHIEYAPQGFEQDALDYIIKPYREDRISKCIRKINSFMEMSYKAGIFDQTVNEDTIMVKDGKQQLYLKVYEIIYLEALKDYTRIISLNKDKKLVTMHSNLGKLLEENINLKDFVRVHKSYAVNKRYIKSLSSQNIVLQNDIKIPIGPAYKSNLENIL